MKKFTYISGVVIVNLFVFGAIFKMQHWPGASILIISGLGLFSLGFLPLALIQSYRDNGKKSLSLYIAGFICAFICFMGAMFKIQHWPGASLFLIIGIPLPFIYFLPVYYFYHRKSQEKSNLNFLGVMFLMLYVAVFSSLMALNVSRDILEAFNTGENDIALTNDVLTLRNELIYKDIQSDSSSEDIKTADLIKQKTDDLYKKIFEVKCELVKASEGDDSQAIETNKINSFMIAAKDETSNTSRILRGYDGNSGQAAQLKNSISEYQKFLESVTTGKDQTVKRISDLLNTKDIVASEYNEIITKSWENIYFPNGIFIIAALSNLSNIETNVRLAEAEALESLR